MVKVLNPQQEGSLVSIWLADFVPVKEISPPCVMSRVQSRELAGHVDCRRRV